MIISNTLSFKFLSFFVFVGLMSTVGGTNTEDKVMKITAFDENNLQGENNPFTTFIERFNQIADAINEKDVTDFTSMNLVDSILDADGVTGIEQSTNIFNSIVAAGGNSDGINADTVDTNAEIVNPVETFFEVFNEIATGINIALNVDGIDDFLALVEVISNIFGIVGDMTQAENIIDSVIGIGDESLEGDSNSELPLFDGSAFSGVTEIVSGISNAFSGFFENLFGFFAPFPTKN